MFFPGEDSKILVTRHTVLNTFQTLNICLSFKSFSSTASYEDFLALWAAVSAALHHIRIDQDTSQLPPYIWCPISQCTFNMHIFFNIVHQISKGEHKISHVFSLVLPRTIFLWKLTQKSSAYHLITASSLVDSKYLYSKIISPWCVL